MNEPRGILVFRANGSGKSIFGKAASGEFNELY